MIKRLYNYELLPEIPEEARNYPLIFVNGSLWTGNDLYESQSSIGKYLQPGDGYLYALSQDGSAWERRRYYADACGVVFAYWSLTGDVSDVWVNRDLPNQYGTIVFRTNDRGTVEYGFWDGGEGDALSIMKFTVPQGFHVAGKWRCIVSGTDSPVAKMEWYRNNVLISTETGKSESECRPTADSVGTFTYKCVITFENGKSVTAGGMTMAVEAYEPGEDPGGGDNPGGGGGDDDETPLVTGIGLNVYPRTVVPGGHATVEVKVYGIGNYSQAFTAELSGNASSKTKLVAGENSCNVWISEEETAEYVLITVTSEQDPYITATEMVYIDHEGDAEESPTAWKIQMAYWRGFAAARAYFREAKVSVSASINIAREEAEPIATKRKLRRSFWKGFVSALIVAASGTAPESVPEGVLISSDGYILTDCDGVYLIAKEDA